VLLILGKKKPAFAGLWHFTYWLIQHLGSCSQLSSCM